MRQASFVERYATKRQDGSHNSKFQAIILEETRKAQEEMAASISQANSSEANITATLLQFPEHEAPKSAEEAELEQAVDDKSVETLLKRIEAATSPEELAALLEEYETALAEWKEKVTSLRSEKHLKEIFAIEAALNMLREMMKNPALQQGQQIAEQLQQGLQSQQQRIAEQAQRSLQQNIQLQEISRQQMMAAASRPQVMPVHQQQNTALDSNRIAQQNAAQRQAQQQAEQAMRYAATTAAVNQQHTVQQVAATVAAVNQSATLAATQHTIQQTAISQTTQQHIQAERVAATTQQQTVNNAIAEKQASQEAVKPAATDKQASTTPIEVKTATQPATTTLTQPSVSDSAGTQSIAKAEAAKDVAVSAAREQSQQEQAMQQGGQKLGRYAQVIANSRCICTEQQQGVGM